jgi:hypothetical protein
MYDGPFCVLSIVDNRTYTRLCYQVLDPDPTHDDIVAFFRPFQAALVVLSVNSCGVPALPEMGQRNTICSIS